MKRFIYFLLCGFSLLVFLMILPLNDYVIQIFGLMCLCVPNIIILLMSFFAKPCKKYKKLACGLIIGQVLIVMVGMSRDYFYTKGFEADSDKPILFVQDKESWGSSVGGRTVKTVYSDGTVYCMGKDLHDNVAFWTREKCDSMTTTWSASTDSSKVEYCHIVFDLKNRTCKDTFEMWGSQESGIKDVNWDLLQKIADREHQSKAQYLYFGI